MKRLVLMATTCAAVTLLAATAAGAGEFYVGGSVGQSSVETTFTGIDPDIDFKGEDTGYKLFGGYALSKHVMFELSAFDLGTVHPKLFDASVDAYGGYASVTGNLPLFKIAGLYGKLGVAWTRVQATATVGNDVVGFEDTGTEAMWGAGVRFNFGPIGVRGEFEVFEFEEADEVSLISVGVEYRF